jgi:hypothetical protein
MGEMKVSNPYEEPILPIAMTAMPSSFFEENENRNKEDYNIKEVSYSDFSLRDGRPFSWEISKNRTLSLEELPTKLYNIKEDKVELAKDNFEIKNYAILSYT